MNAGPLQPPIDPPATATSPTVDALPLRMIAWVGAVVAIGLVLTAYTHPGGGPNNHLVIGWLLGNCWGQTTLSAAWFALGPGRNSVRVVGPFVWLALLLGAFGVCVAFHGGGPPDDIVGVVALCVGAQWLLLQVPLGSLRWWFGYRLQRVASGAPGKLQFGMRDLFIFTAVIAVILGAARALFSVVGLPGLTGEAPIFAMLTAAAILTTLPLVVAMFVRNYFIAAVALAVFFIAVMIPGQLQFMSATGLGGPDIWHLIWINTFQAMWALLVGGIVRAFGYRLGR